MKNMNQPMEARLWFLIIFLSMVWGASFFFVEIAVEKMTPLTIVLCRVGFAAFLLLGFVWFTGRKMPKNPGIWGAFLAIGMLSNVIPFTLITWGQQYIDSSLASILNASTPVFSVILAHFLTKDEPLTISRLTGVLFGWMGVAVLIGVEVLNDVGMNIAGQFAVVGAAIFYALSAILGRRFKELDPVVMAAGMLTSSFIILMPLAFIIEQPLALEPTSVTWAALFGLSAFSTALAFIVYFYVLSEAGATNTSMLTFLAPVSTIFLGMIILRETPGWNAFVGLALIFMGLIFIDGRLLKRFKNYGHNNK